MDAKAKSLAYHLSTLPDPHKVKGQRHVLLDIIIAVLATICGVDDWEGIEEFGKEKEPWLRSFLELPNHIPSHDTFNCVFQMLEPRAFGEDGGPGDPAHLSRLFGLGAAPCLPLHAGLLPGMAHEAGPGAPAVCRRAPRTPPRHPGDRGVRATPVALGKRNKKITTDSFPVQDYRGILKALATQTQQIVQPAVPKLPTFRRVTPPTPYQQRAFELLQLSAL